MFAGRHRPRHGRAGGWFLAFGDLEINPELSALDALAYRAPCYTSSSGKLRARNTRMS